MGDHDNDLGAIYKKPKQAQISKQLAMVLILKMKSYQMNLLKLMSA